MQGRVQRRSAAFGIEYKAAREELLPKLAGSCCPLLGDVVLEAELQPTERLMLCTASGAVT